MTSPAQLDQPFHFWMLDRLVVYLTQIKGIPIKRSRLSEIFRQEGLRWRHQEDWFGERVDPDFAEKRGHRNPLHCPPPANSVVVCIDEMGPLSTRSHPGQELVATQPTESKPAGRAKQEVDCGRTQREGYVFGAFQPASGEVVIATSTSRSIKHFVDFLDQVEAAIPLSIEQVYVVLDNLGAHQAYDVLLFNLAHLRSICFHIDFAEWTTRSCLVTCYGARESCSNSASARWKHIVFLPAQICRLLQLDRAMVENPQITG